MLNTKSIQDIADRYTAYQQCFQHGESENPWDKAYEKAVECMDDIPKLIDEVTYLQNLIHGLQRVRVHACTVPSSDCWYKNRINEEFFIVPLTEEHSDRYLVFANIEGQTRTCPIKKEDVSLVRSIILLDEAHLLFTNPK
ncbi:hypothetical protein [Bacillus paranthracis]|uniref:hypothetical protein n=1 Tax=Bacillus paranthracis TaxID=2026186 RepID=UPI002FDC136D|nr:hypothetical protein [Bacillus paranthracis]